MKADAHDLTTIFGFPRQLFVPIFQRPYVWEQKKQWEPLWEDLTKIANHLLKCRQEQSTDRVKPHFLGAVVLDQHPMPVGRPDARSLIDGQQRLMTVQMVLMALRDVLPRSQNCERLIGTLEELIFNKFVKDEADRLKVSPTNVDRAVYSAVATTDSPEELAEAIEQHNLDPESRIARAYRFFYSAAKEWIDFSEDENRWLPRAEALIDAIRQKVRLVVIDMDDQDEAQVIFETLNARGTPLLEADLVKNHLFRMAKTEGHDINRLYASHWKSFEDEDRFWRKEMTQGRLKRPAIEIFLQHYLTLQLNKEISATRLFDTFKDWAFENPDKTAEWHFQQIQRHARHFKRFMQIGSDTPEAAFFQRLGIMDTTTVFPFLLWLYEATSCSEDAKLQRLGVLTTIESFLVRRMVCRLTTKNYNRLFLDLHQRAGKCEPKDVGGEVRTFLLEGEGDSVRWPPNEEFRDAWCHTPIYNKIARARVRMILSALNENMPDKRTEGVYVKEKLTIEHVMPRDWQSHWPLPQKEDESTDDYFGRNELRHLLIQTIGNLTLLTRPLNAEISNRPFNEKLEQILTYSKLSLNFDLKNYSEWTEKEILKRGAALFEVANSIWPCLSGEEKGEVVHDK